MDCWKEKKISINKSVLHPVRVILKNVCGLSIQKFIYSNKKVLTDFQAWGLRIQLMVPLLVSVLKRNFQC
jgi:hypothetical protein